MKKSSNLYFFLALAICFVGSYMVFRWYSEYYSTGVYIREKELSGPVEHFNIDKLKETGETVEIVGWAAQSNKESNPLVGLVQRNGDHICLLKTYNIQRPDVTTHLSGKNIKLKDDRNGFHAFGREGGCLLAGKYQIVIFYPSKSGIGQAYTTDRWVEFK